MRGGDFLWVSSMCPRRVCSVRIVACDGVLRSSCVSGLRIAIGGKLKHLNVKAYASF